MRITRIGVLAASAAVALVALARPLAAALDDAAIAGIFNAANGWDISTGKLAAKKASRADVRAFGKQLARDHQGLLDQAHALEKKLGVTVPALPKDFALKQDFDSTMKKLKSLKGPAFDSAFLEHEIAYHKAVINAVTAQLLPAIENPELKTFVEQSAPAFQAHLAQAEALLAKK